MKIYDFVTVMLEVSYYSCESVGNQTTRPYGKSTVLVV